MKIEVGITNKSFTLIETLVAIAILLVAVTAAMTLSFQSIRSASLIKNKFIASMLAQEGVELVKNQRDSNFIDNKDWLCDIETAPGCTGNPCGSANGCQAILNPANGKVRFASCTRGCDLMKINNDYFYGYLGGSETVFRRRILVNEIVNDREAGVTVIVEWPERFSTQSVTIVGHIFNWL